MAKRKRLSGPNPDFLAAGTGLETKAMHALGITPTVTRRPAPPIADVAGDAATVAALDEVSSVLENARANGRLVLQLPLSDVRPGYLVRDRIAVDDEEMQALKDSISARGQQTPIEVADLGDGTFGLISGWRRYQALERLLTETRADRFNTVLALLRRPEESSDAYLAMVEENEIRVGLSYYERACIATKAVEQGVFETEKKALLALFASVSRTKRSKIRSFLTLVAALDGGLRFPEAIGERLGLQLAKALNADAGLAARLLQELGAAAPLEAAAELDILRRAATPEASKKQSLKGALGTESTPKNSLAPPVQIRPGLRLDTRADGSLVLRGDEVDDRLRDALIGWLERDG